MHFNTQLQFLGLSAPQQMKDGGVLYKVSFYDPNAAAPLTLNMMGNREDMVNFLSSCKFGAFLDCNFALTAKDNLYRLSLVACQLAGK